MPVYIAQRLAQSIIVMLIVALVAFSLFQFVGDPINAMVGQDTTQTDREALRHSLGLDAPVPVQFLRWVGRAVQGDFGLSYQLARPVGQLILEKMPATLELALTAALLALAVGVPMGVYTGLRPDSWLSRIFLGFSLIGVSLPTFLIGILLILIFAVWLRWLPSFGRGGVVQIGRWSTGFLTLEGWRALILPAITLALYQLTLTMRLVRAEMLEVLRTDYIKFARARGLTDRAVNFGHALRNTLVPVVTVVGLQLGQLIAFAIITETVFQWPGMGLMFIQAVGFADIPVMSAYLVLVAFFFVVINLTVDLLYYLIDPRLRVSHG
ncbi:MAG: peptide/nickel transport system permease protein [Aliidongia sp.]|jgi:peptide/nickel transport system permease protein|nr:peptide/nickel transport system permease protein [Aliidongia sp.]